MEVTSRKAFTLVELLVVIAIIAVLLAVLLPSLAGARSLAKRLQCGEKLAGIGRAFTAYTTAYDSLLPSIEFPDPPYKCIQHYYLTNRGGSWCHLGCLWAMGLVDSPSHFYCPATENWQSDFGGNMSRMPVKTLKGYVYWPMSKEDYTQVQWLDLRNRKDQAANENYFTGLPRSATRQSELLMTHALISDYSFHAVKSYGKTGWAISALFPDGHVKFQTQPLDDGLGTGGMADKGKGMWHEMRQFPGGICTISNWNTLAVWTDPKEAQNNVAYKSQIVRFVYALEP
jgi:prepilin-type N-terminal cleavage/methylation domain-containing protein